MTPMMQQYFQIKNEYKDYLVFFRLGDFYEMFFDDAIKASRELDIVLTGRDCGEAERAPMCGVPFHSADSYIARLVEKGYRIAICEQTEAPGDSPGIVRREVVRVITPGTIVDKELLDETQNNYLASLYFTGSSCACSFCDISEKTVCVTHLFDESRDQLLKKVINELAVFTPREVLCNVDAAAMGEVYGYCSDRLASTVISDPTLFSDEKTADFKIQSEKNARTDKLSPLEERAVAAIYSYLLMTQKREPSISRIDSYNDKSFVCIDAASRKNLELCRNIKREEKKGSLLYVLDKTKTPLGARFMRKSIEKPLTNCRAIERRQNAVEELYENAAMREGLSDIFGRIQDLERLLSKILYSTPLARDVLGLKNTLAAILQIPSVLTESKSDELKQINAQLRNDLIVAFSDLWKLLDESVNEDAPTSLREGSLIKKGYSSEVDTLRTMLTESREFLARVESLEKEVTGIKGLKIGYNKVFGYYIEITNSYLSQVPDRYIRKQTLSNCERFVTSELKEAEARILGAKDKSVVLEYEIFLSIVEKIKLLSDKLGTGAELVARLDFYTALADVAINNNFVRPSVDYSDEIYIKDGRHPVVEQFSDSYFVPNDTVLDCENNRLAIITGPNMAGKSTYMRQVAIIVLMAQIGSFVPAREARIGVVDKIFTRIGSGDDLAGGQSTFMVEMTEVAYILKNATARSLIIYDEIGRGTSTYDGMSIAKAVIEYTASKKLGARTLFATHYHELAVLEKTVDGIKNYNIAAKKHGDGVVFLRKILPGFTDDSFGIEVAKLAGIPDGIVSGARKTLARLEAGTFPYEQKEKPKPQAEQTISMFDNSAKVIDELKSINVDTLTPLEAMFKLNDLVKKAKHD